MKEKHSQWIVFLIVVGLVILGVLSENDEATVTKVTSEAEAKSEGAGGEETNIPVDPGGLQPDPSPGTTKDTQDVKPGDELDKEQAVVETTKDEEESKPRSDKSDMDKDSKDTPPSTLMDGGDGETATITNEDGHKDEQPSRGESASHVEESVVKSDDQTTPPVSLGETEDVQVTQTSEDTLVSHTLEVPGSEVVNSSPEIETSDLNKSEPEPVPVDPEFQTFTEFFEQNKQAEEEKKKKQSKLTDIPGTEVLQKKQQKRVVNVASRECGAKVISSNPEVENPRGVLTSNKDDYMINPCKAAKKWFVIELCEPARVKSLEVASFELFSSQPQTFRVQFSEGYPTKDWQVMEPFSATEARAIQTFTVPEHFNDYVKFVRVEMMDHFGEEHFCPLTIFRVLGVLVEYDAYMGQQIDDTASDIDSAMVNDADDTEGDSEVPKNLFASATESVIKIVKKVLNVGDKTSQVDLGLNETVDTNATETSNMTSEDYMLPCVPGEEDVSKPSSTMDQPNTPVPGETGTSTQSATPQSTESHEQHSGAVDDKSASIVTKLEDHEQVPSSQDEQPLVTLLDREDADLSLLDLVTKCLTKTPRKMGSKKTINSTKRASVFCNYVQILLRNSRPGTCSMKRIPPAVRPEAGGQDIDSHSSEWKVAADNSFIIVTKDVVSEASTTAVSNTTGSNRTQPSPPSQSTLTVPTPADVDTSTMPGANSQLSSPSPDRSVDGVPTVSVPVATVAAVIIEPSKVVSHEEVSVTVIPVTIEDTLNSQVTDQNTLTPGEVTLDPSIVSASVQVDTSQTTPALDSGAVMRSEVEKSKPSVFPDSLPVGSQEPSENVQNPDAEMEVSSTKNEIVSTKVFMTIEPPDTSDNLEIFDNDAEVMSSIVDKLASAILDDPQSGHSRSAILDDPQNGHSRSAILDDPQNGHSRIINDTVMAGNATQKSSGAQKDLGLVNVKVPVLSYSKREIALMRLANRINALEMNVTLSIRFLERMSQKFKTKSDEMIKALNKTDTKLEETVMEATTRGKEQDEHMKSMEIRLRNLTVMVEEMVHNMDTLNQKVTDRQMVWTSVEVVILVVIFMVCLKRGKSPSYIPMPPEVQKILEKFPTEMDLTAIPRRNSFHGTSQRNSAEMVTGSLQKYNSETALSCNRQDISSYDPGGTTKDSSSINQQNDLPKRKKRKKKSPDVKLCGVPSSSEFKDDSSLAESHTNFNSAGLLFGASPGETTVCEKLNRTNSQHCVWNVTSDNNRVSEVDPTYCKSAYSDTSGTSKGQGSKVRVSCSTNDLPLSVPGGTSKGFKAKAHSFTNELPVSVISSKPPKCPGATQGGGKSKRGSPPTMRALADPGGGVGGAAKKKRQNYGHSMPLGYTTLAPAEVETVQRNGHHVLTSQTTDNRQCMSQQHRPKRKSHTRASSADLSSSPRADTTTTSWKKLLGWK